MGGAQWEVCCGWGTVGGVLWVGHSGRLCCGWGMMGGASWVGCVFNDTQHILQALNAQKKRFAKEKKQKDEELEELRQECEVKCESLCTP